MGWRSLDVSIFRGAPRRRAETGSGLPARCERGDYLHRDCFGGDRIDQRIATPLSALWFIPGTFEIQRLLHDCDFPHPVTVLGMVMGAGGGHRDLRNPDLARLPLCAHAH